MIKNNNVYDYDAINLMELLLEERGEGCVNMILCDLPYTYKGKARVTANKWDTPIDTERFFELASYLLEENGVICLTATQPFTSHLVSTLERMSTNDKYSNVNLVNYKYEWIWEKDNGSNFVHVKHQPFRVHESILVFGKSATTYNKKGNYMCYNPQFTQGKPYSMKRKSMTSNLATSKGYERTDGEYDGKRYPRSIQKFNLEKGLHPTQKPVSLFSYLINTHSNNGDLVLDVCCGSGTTAISCIETNRDYIVNDLDFNYYETTVKRICEYKALKNS